MSNLLLLDKPLGMTSQQAVSRIKKIFNIKKAGHTGTLDPLASGMLPICFDEATKFTQYLLQEKKQYTVTMQFGTETDTLDREGQVIKTASVPSLTAMDLENILQSFIGTQTQTPPIFSALKVNGEALYKKARRGETVEIKARTIYIENIQLLEMALPYVRLQCVVGSGTYIRSLVRDIAYACGSCAHVSELRRDYVYPFANAVMWRLADLATHPVLAETVLPISAGLSHLRKVSICAEEAKRLSHGLKIAFDSSTEETVQLWSDGNFLGVGKILPSAELMKLRFLIKPNSS